MHERTFLRAEVRNKETKSQNPTIGNSCFYWVCTQLQHHPCCLKWNLGVEQKQEINKRMRSRRYALTCCKHEPTISSDGHHQLWWADWKSVALVKLSKMEHFPIRFGYLQQQNRNQPYPKFRLPQRERNREREFEFKVGDHGLQRSLRTFSNCRRRFFPRLVKKFSWFKC